VAPSAGHRDAYRRRFRRVRRAFVAEDPVFLIEAGGRTDEYDAVVRRVLGLIDAERGSEIATLLPTELEERFGVAPDGARLARLVGELARVGPYRA
jgi:hypothetical protein